VTSAHHHHENIPSIRPTILHFAFFVQKKSEECCHFESISCAHLIGQWAA
jgi:hypothetical protein